MGSRELPSGDETARAVTRFNEAWNRHDIDAVLACMTDDCVFESTRPVPDGDRYEGKARMRAFLESFFTRSPDARFTTEEMITAGDRAVVRWRYDWVRDGAPGHVRGVDVLRVRDGLVSEKLAYVKG